MELCVKLMELNKYEVEKIVSEILKDVLFVSYRYYDLIFNNIKNVKYKLSVRR